MAGNTLLTVADISDRATAILQDSSALLNLVYREKELEGSPDRNRKKPGETFSMRVPERVTETTGRVAQVQAVTQTYVDITVDQQQHQAFVLTVQEKSLSIDSLSERVIEPRMSQMAASIEKDVNTLHTGVWQSAGTPGTPVNSYTLVGNAVQKLDEIGADAMNRWMVLNPASKWAYAEYLHDLPTDMSRVPDDALTKGFIGMTHDFRKGIHMSNGIAVHTNGAFGTSTPLTNGTTADGATQVVTDGWESGAGNVAVGDVFTLAGVYAVHPETRASTGSLMQFVVNTAASDTTGDMTISFSPTLRASGRYQNVTATPANDAALTFKGSAGGIYPQCLVGIPSSIALSMVDQDVSGFRTAAKSDYKGVRLAVIEGEDATNHQVLTRIDAIYGRTLYIKEGLVRLWA